MIIEPSHQAELLLAASDQAVRQALADLRALMAQWGVAPGDCGTVELVLAEALNNIVEHAYAGQPAEGITLFAQLRENRLLLIIRDAGHPLPGLALPEGKLPDHNVAVQDLPEGGFGWFLIHTLTSALIYRRDGTENRLELEIPLGQAVS